MSKTTIICCSRCGRDLYAPISHDKREPKHIDYYVIPIDGVRETELCKACFEQWVKEGCYGRHKIGN